MVTETIGWRA